MRRIPLSKSLIPMLMAFAMTAASLGNKTGIVHAQDISTEPPVTETTAAPTSAPTDEPTSAPTATDAPTATEAPTVTQEPILEPTFTLEPTLTETLTPEPTLTETPTPTLTGLTNLVVQAPDGWDAPIVISTQTGTHSSDELTNGEEEYIDLAVYNAGDPINTPFNVCLDASDGPIHCWDVESLGAGEYFTVEDWPYTADRGDGSHYFEIVADSENSIAETDEDDNQWEYNFSWMPSDISAQSEKPPLIHDAFERPDVANLSGLSETGSSAPGYTDVSAFMSGSVAVGIILPESTGTGIGHEDWTTTEQNAVAERIQTGLNRWAAWSSSYASPDPISNQDGVNMNVSFVYDVHNSVATNYEPITMSSTDQCMWISQVLAKMGYPVSNDCMNQIYEYLDTLRSKKGTDWATVIFVVDSSEDYADVNSDTRGAFSDGYFAYAYINGPMIMMTYNNGGYGISDMDQVVQHEMGHIFGAADNYYEAGYGGCEDNSTEYGYLGIINSNCEFNNSAADTDVLMNDNNRYRNHWTAQYQVGWRDSDGDGIADVLDTTPSFTLDSFDSNTGIFSGVVYDDPYPAASSYTSDSVTINTITAASYRVDSGSWYTISAADGSFNTDYEPVTFNLPPNVSGGVHTLYVQATNSEGISYTSSTDFTRNAAANDLITNAVTMTLGTSYTVNSAGATLSPSGSNSNLIDPQNILDSGDVYSLWYKFTAPTTAVYTINTYGSETATTRNLTVLKRVSDTSRTLVAYGNVNYDGSETEDYYSLSFNAVSGTTYLFGISGTGTADDIYIKVEKPTCGSGYLCGAAVDGDGEVMHWPTMEMWDAGGNYSGSTTGNYSGYVTYDLSSNPTGTYTAITSGSVEEKSLVLSEEVTAGYFTPTALGYPSAVLTVEDTTGSAAAADKILVRFNGTNFYTTLDGLASGSTEDLYLPVDTYDFFVSTADEYSGLGSVLQIYRSDVAVTTGADPNEIDLDASALAHDTFTFDLDGFDSGIVNLTSPFGVEEDVDFSGVSQVQITVAASTGTTYDSCGLHAYDTDGSFNQWDYNLLLDEDVSITGGTDHEYQVGGTVTALPSVPDQPIMIEDGYAYVYAGITDGYSHPIRKMAIVGGSTILPTYVVKDSNGTQVYSGTHSNSSTYPLAATSRFTFPTSSPVGTWTVQETVNLGPLGGGSKTFSSTFTMDTLANYPLANDDFDSPIVISTMPYSLEGLDTRSGTTASDDPVITALKSQGVASAWFSYTPTKNGTLTVDTFDSTYDTVLNVWQGSRGSLTNLAYNDDYNSGSSTVSQSRVSLSLTRNTTYYIEVTQYSSGDASVKDQSLSEQSVAGKLNLHATFEVVLDCYSLSALPNSTTYGSVTISPAANCGTKYTEDTEITLTAVSKDTYGFMNWSNAVTDSPYTFEITGDTTLKANFVKIAAPVITSPANGLITNDTTPTFTWNAVTYGNTYQIQIDNLSAFSAPIDQTAEVSELTYTADSLTTEGVKYYRVRAVNSRGETGAWSTVRSFTLDTIPPAAPTLSKPVNNAWVRGIPTYSWAVPTGANAYQFEYDTNSDFSTATISTVLARASYKPADQTVGIYYWRVKSRDAAGNWSVDWSAYNTVTILAPIPAKPTITGLTAMVLTGDASPVLNWSSVAFSNGYQVQVSSSSKFLSGFVVNQWVDSATLAQELDPGLDGTFYARVRAKNIYDETGSWSSTYTITIDTTAQAVPTISSPVDGSIVNTVMPKLAVKSVSGTKYYQYQVNTSDDFISPLVDVTTTSTSYTLTAAQSLPFGTAYWRVRSIDAAGNASEWSDAYSFKVTIQKTPLNGSFTTSTKPTLSWNKISGATGYELSVCMDEVMSANCVISTTLGAVTGYTPTTVLTTGKYYWQIQVIGGGYADELTPVLDFTVMAAPLVAPVLNTPASGTITNDTTPEFTWSAVSGTINYEIQISKGSSYKTLEQTTVQTGTAYTAGVLGDGTYYWRVRALDDLDGPGKWTSSRKITIDTTAQAVPTISSPVDGSIVNTVMPKLAVKSVSGTKYYQYQVNTSDDFISPLVDVTTTSTSYTLTAAQSLPFGTAYWRVRSIDAAGNASEWSDAYSFKVTIQKAPVEGSFTTSTKPALSWNKISGATGYRLSVCMDEAMSANCAISTTLGAVTGYTPTTVLTTGKYYWQIEVIGGGAYDGEQTAILSFTISPVVPAAPVLTAPASGNITNDNTPDLNWAAVSGAENYEVQISKTAKFTTLEQDKVQTGTSYTAETLADGTYYWRVKALNSLEAPGKWSSVRNFTVDTAAQEVPAISSPVDGSIVSTIMPKLTVGKVSGTKYYQYQVNTSEDFTTPLVDVTTTSTSYTLTAAQSLPFGTAYWRVRSVDAAGNASEWSETSAFTVTIQKAPVNKTYTTTAQPKFTWMAITGATGYELKVCTDEEMTTGCTAFDLTGITTSFTLPNAIDDGRYYWQIQVYGGGNYADEWTPILTFTKVH